MSNKLDLVPQPKKLAKGTKIPKHKETAKPGLDKNTSSKNTTDLEETFNNRSGRDMAAEFAAATKGSRLKAEQFVYARTRADPGGPPCTCLYHSLASSSDSLMSSLHQADVRVRVRVNTVATRRLAVTTVPTADLDSTTTTTDSL